MRIIFGTDKHCPNPAVFEKVVERAHYLRDKVDWGVIEDLGPNSFAKEPSYLGEPFIPSDHLKRKAESLEKREQPKRKCKVKVNYYDFCDNSFGRKSSFCDCVRCAPTLNWHCMHTEWDYEHYEQRIERMNMMNDDEKTTWNDSSRLKPADYWESLKEPDIFEEEPEPDFFSFPYCKVHDVIPESSEDEEEF